MTGGSPSLRRRRLMVTVTVVVNGSACSSHAVSRRSVAGRDPRNGVEFDPGLAQDAGSRGGLAAGEGADAQHELGEVERLGEVVVGAQAQAANPVLRRAGRGQHQHHGPLVAGGDHLAEGVAVDTGQVAVEDDHVVGVDVESGRGFQPVAGDVHGHALVSQALGYPVGKGAGVLGHQDPHTGTTAWLAVMAAARGASGSVIVTVRPPPGLACSCREPRCASVIAATIDRPSPAPSSEPVRSAPSRRNGWASPATWAWSRMSPPFSMISRAAPSPAVVVMRIQPPSRLWLTALPITLSAIRRSSGALPSTQMPSLPARCCTARFLAVIASSYAARAADTT